MPSAAAGRAAQLCWVGVQKHAAHRGSTGTSQLAVPEALKRCLVQVLGPSCWEDVSV